MAYTINKNDFNTVLAELSKEYMIYAPKRFVGGGTYSDTDMIRYGQITSVDEIVFNEKSAFSYKEVLTPISDTLFYFTEDEMKEADGPTKGAIVFLRSCDLHSVKRIDDIYLKNGAEDYYYKRIREKTKFVLIGCQASFDNCFCVSMGTNQATNYDAYIKVEGDEVKLDSNLERLNQQLEKHVTAQTEIAVDYVTENKVKVSIPENMELEDIVDAPLWEEYKARCIGCGRCNFVCPTCTCFTMQDIFYSDNGKAGERRRVWASCMVNGYTDMAGGHSFRGDMGQRMRFKVMHKVNDYKKRFGYHMCVGCGRCDDVCPEYISFSNCVNKVSDFIKEKDAQ